MAEKVTLERQPAPAQLDENDSTYRLKVQQAWDEKEPKYRHVWQAADAKDEDLARKGQEVVKQNGKPIKDNFGDFLVRQDREAFDRKIAAQQRQSLEDMVATVADPNKADADGIEVDADLAQEAQAKKPRKAPMKVKLGPKE